MQTKQIVPAGIIDTNNKSFQLPDKQVILVFVIIIDFEDFYGFRRL